MKFKHTRPIVAALGVALACWSAVPAEPEVVAVIPIRDIGKCGLSAEAVSDLLALSVTEFDQSPSGFRGLGFRQCYVDAALMIDLYIATHADRLQRYERVALTWHAAQMYAHAGKPLYDVAVRRAEQSMEGNGDPSWAAYIAATIAFLRQDLPQLKASRDTLAERGEQNRVNLLSVERLIKCFGKPYAEAYSPQSCPL